jgi:predicted GH43/DUF377 family glycosyl hydrolase
MSPRPRSPLPSLAAASLLALAACTAAQDPSAPPSPTSSEMSEPTAEASTMASSLDFTFPDGEQPAVTRELTGIDERYINPGAVIEHEGQLHMFANVFTAWPGRVAVPHLVSTDGVEWTLAQPEPVLTVDDVPLANPGFDVSTGFVTDDGTWTLIFETVNLTAPWVLGMATAPGPDGPWTVQEAAILEPGEDGSFDAGGLHWPSVVRTDDGYLMFYAAFTTAGTRASGGTIALATSDDGLAWTKHETPVMEPEAEWEGANLDRPRVAVTPDGLVMLYAGQQLTEERGVAWSQDGITWERDGDAPAITADDFPIDGNTWDTALRYADGTLTYWMEIGTASGSGGTQVYRATTELP